MGEKRFVAILPKSAIELLAAHGYVTESDGEKYALGCLIKEEQRPVPSGDVKTIWKGE